MQLFHKAILIMYWMPHDRFKQDHQKMFKHTKKKAWYPVFFFFFLIINYRSTTKNFGNSTAEEIVVKWQDMKTKWNIVK